MNKVPYTHQLVQEYGAAIRQQVIDAVRAQLESFRNRAVSDCLSRLGLALPEAGERLTRHCGPSWEELYLDGAQVLRVSWEYVGERGFCMTRKFHGPAELIPIT